MLQDWSWGTWDAHVKALQDLRVDQNLLGKGDKESLRLYPAIKLQGDNLLKGTKERKDRSVIEQAHQSLGET